MHSKHRFFLSYLGKLGCVFVTFLSVVTVETITDDPFVRLGHPVSTLSSSRTGDYAFGWPIYAVEFNSTASSGNLVFETPNPLRALGNASEFRVNTAAAVLDIFVLLGLSMALVLVVYAFITISGGCRISLRLFIALITICCFRFYFCGTTDASSLEQDFSSTVGISGRIVTGEMFALIQLMPYVLVLEIIFCDKLWSAMRVHDSSTKPAENE